MYVNMVRIFLICCCFCYSVSAKEVIRLTNGEWPPYASESLPNYGVMSQIVVEAFALEGVEVHYEFFPWQRAYKIAKEGKWDGSITWAPTPTRMQDFYFSEPVVMVSNALFHLKATQFDWQRFSDLSQWQIGSTRGYTYGIEWEQLVADGVLRPDEVTYDAQNIQRLLKDRIDAIAMEIDVANYYIRKQLTPEQAELITYHPKLLERKAVCMVLSRNLEKSPRLMRQFNRGLMSLIQSGRYQEIIDEFQLIDEAKHIFNPQNPDSWIVPE